MIHHCQYDPRNDCTACRSEEDATMKKIKVTWTTTETIEWTETIEVDDDFDPDSLHGNSQELVDREATGGELVSFYREIDVIEIVEEA